MYDEVTKKSEWMVLQLKAVIFSAGDEDIPLSHTSRSAVRRYTVFCRLLEGHLDSVQSSSCFMYGDQLPKKTIHSGILQIRLLSHSFVSKQN
jgi:hypothetical protein